MLIFLVASKTVLPIFTATTISIDTITILQVMKGIIRQQYFTVLVVYLICFPFFRFTPVSNTISCILINYPGGFHISHILHRCIAIQHCASYMSKYVCMWYRVREDLSAKNSFWEKREKRLDEGSKDGPHLVPTLSNQYIVVFVSLIHPTPHGPLP